MAVDHLGESQRLSARLETLLLANGGPFAHHDPLAGPHHLARDDPPLQRSPLLRIDAGAAGFPSG